MEAQDQEMTIKKKRTKRPRTASPLSLTMASSSCSAGEGDDHISRAVGSPSSSGGLARSAQEEEEEEEDMANCLILLAQGRHEQKSSEDQTANLATQKAATDVYQCKTCNRCFPSFQALGGHRASHKKPKPTQEDQNEATLHRMIGFTGISRTTLKDQPPAPSKEETTTVSLQITTRPLCNNSNNKLRVHECSICGAEFNSGQALGGHMRRHRPIPAVPSYQEECSLEAKKPRAILSLDLNLPAPEDDHHHQEAKFPLAAKEQVIVFTASSLVDCHY